MRRSRLLNGEISKLLSEMGHTQYVVIGDCGLPVPEGVRLIDLSIERGLPTFKAVLDVIASEFVYEKCLYADEIEEKNPECLRDIKACLGDIEYAHVSHEEFKRISRGANAIIRTGETSPYANVALYGGVDF